jgi:hypothetical protein
LKRYYYLHISVPSCPWLGKEDFVFQEVGMIAAEVRKLTAFKRKKKKGSELNIT